jgi:hypothetical protein
VVTERKPKLFMHEMLAAFRSLREPARERRRAQFLAPPSLRFRVLIDGRPPGAAHGTDVDDQGIGTLTEQRMYQLIRQPKPITERLFEIEFLDPGAEAFAFTFG